MKNKIINDIATDIAEKHSPGFSSRQAHRKTLWHLPKILLVPLAPFPIWYVLFKLMTKISNLLEIHPNSSVTGIPELLFLIPLFLPAAGLGLIACNIILFCIPPARQAFAKEAKSEESLSFYNMTKPVIILTIKYFLPIGFGLSSLGLYLMATTS